MSNIRKTDFSSKQENNDSKDDAIKITNKQIYVLDLKPTDFSSKQENNDGKNDKNKRRKSIYIFYID